MLWFERLTNKITCIFKISIWSIDQNIVVIENILHKIPCTQWSNQVWKYRKTKTEIVVSPTLDCNKHATVFYAY